MKKLNIKAYCRRSWGNYYQEKVRCNETIINNSTAKQLSKIKKNYKKTFVERFGIKLLYVVFFIFSLFIILIMIGAYDEFNTKKTIIEKIYFIPYFLLIFLLAWIYIWFKSSIIFWLFGSNAWWFSPFAWYQIFFYHKIVHNMNNIYAGKWKLCLCETYVTSQRKSFSRKKITYLSHYGYTHKNKDKLLPINIVPEANNHYWKIDNYILCVYANDINIPIPLDKKLNCISCLSIYEKEKIHQKISQAVENYFNSIEA